MVERIKERSMMNFVLSTLINFGIGLVFGFIVGIIFTIMTSGLIALYTMLVIPVIGGVVVASVSSDMYRTYFYYRLSMDIDALCEGDGQESESYIIAAVLSTITFGIYRLYWLYKLAQRLRVNSPRYGFKMFESGKDIVVLDAFSFGYISAWEFIKNVNRVAGVYNQTGLADVNIGGVS
ncbi:MAG: DUF4234 domain-containing protein [Oscillospiraceae bacterium]|nr:DUF4234 domain-containing protein [Oscillospiraceae bacterium]